MFHLFNLNIIPTEIINRAIINKTSQAHKSISAIGGAVDFSTIKPLDYRYAKGKKLFDKRETIKDRDNKRALDRVKKNFK